MGKCKELLFYISFSSICEHKTSKSESKSEFFKDRWETDQYTLIEHSGNYSKRQVVLNFSALNCFEMHVVHGLSSHLGNSDIMNLYYTAYLSILGKNFEHCSKAQA